MSIEINDLADTLMKFWLNGVRTTPALLGSPGIGKTSVGGLVVEHMQKHLDAKGDRRTAKFMPIELSSALVEDINGTPREKNGVLEYLFDAQFAEMMKPDAVGVLMLDDLAAADRGVHSACRQIVLNRSIHGVKFSDDVLIIVTGNRVDDKSNAAELPSHFISSVFMLNTYIDFSRWVGWARANNVHEHIIAFLSFRGSLFTGTPDMADTEYGAFPSPRAWTQLGQAYEYLPTESLIDWVGGKVGSGPGLEFVSFINNMTSLASAEKVYADPEKALKDVDLNDPSVKSALLYALYEYHNSLGKDDQNISFLMEAVVAVGKSPDYVSFIISLALIILGENETSVLIAEMIRASKHDDKIKSFRDSYIKANK
jgi:hypothetical protein